MSVSATPREPSSVRRWREAAVAASGVSPSRSAGVQRREGRAVGLATEVTALEQQQAREREDDEHCRGGGNDRDGRHAATVVV